jgi:Ca2+-binding RTX toxin-like protein
MNGTTGRLVRRFSLASLVAVSFAASTLASAPPAGAQESLAANCEPPRENTSTGFDALAQSFTAQLAGPVTRAEIAVTNDPAASNDYVVEIRTVDASSRPTDTVLATATVPDASLPAGASIISASFPNPANVATGGVYALVVHRSGEDPQVGFREGNDCAGVAWFSSDGSVANFQTFADQYDLVYRIFVPTLFVPTLTSTPQATCSGKQATKVGTEGNDKITGTPDRDVIAALDGKDKVSGLGGKDLICGGAGKDTLNGGAAKDTLLGEGGKDKLKGGGAKDTCTGGKGNDSGSSEVEKSV